MCAVPAGQAWNSDAWAELGGHVEEAEDLLFHGDVLLVNYRQPLVYGHIIKIIRVIVESHLLEQCAHSHNTSSMP